MSVSKADDFDVDLSERRVVHKPSGIEVEFYEYPDDGDWQKSNSVVLRDNPIWPGDRRELARRAKEAAIAAGMKARKPVGLTFD